MYQFVGGDSIEIDTYFPEHVYTCIYFVVDTGTLLTSFCRQWASSRQIESYDNGVKKRLHTKSRSKLFFVGSFAR